MSNHQFQTEKFLVSLGIDTILEHVFATLRVKSQKPASDFPVNETFALSIEGVDDAVQFVEDFVHKSEPRWSLPMTVQIALDNDLLSFAAGLDINYVRVHDSEDGHLDAVRSVD
jgi:hypothetical protein